MYGETESGYHFIDLNNTSSDDRYVYYWILTDYKEPQKNNVGEKKTWPCREESVWWDENGVNYTQIPNENCNGINTSFTPSLRVGQFRPDHKNRQDGENNWAFSNYLQIGSDLSILP